MPKRTHHIDQLIVNSPSEEPAEHWSYDRESRLFTRTPGRRSAGYVVATEGSKSFDDPGVFVELPLITLTNAYETALNSVSVHSCSSAVPEKGPNL